MKVFLSSTFQDLQEHRKRVIDAIDRLRVNGADISWLGMEAFGARDDLPSDACVKFVDECELYVGFFGVRYGSIDPKSKLSMTEVEYRRARRMLPFPAIQRPRRCGAIDQSPRSRACDALANPERWNSQRLSLSLCSAVKPFVETNGYQSPNPLRGFLAQ
jgi:hypothetical protein